MKELTISEIESVSGASLVGALVVITGAVLGAAAGTCIGGPGIGTVAGAISGGGHALALWEAAN